MSPPGRAVPPNRPAMGRSLADLLENYLASDEAPEPDVRPRRAATAEVRTVLETAMGLAAAVAPASVVGVAYSSGPGETIVRFAGVRDIDRSLTLGDRLAESDSRGLADVEAEHFLVRTGDRLRLGVDRGGVLDAEQRALLQGVALLASRALARSGVDPLSPSWRQSAPVPADPAPGHDPAGDLGFEVA
jgi:hypothetical protein